MKTKNWKPLKPRSEKQKKQHAWVFLTRWVLLPCAGHLQRAMWDKSHTSETLRKIDFVIRELKSLVAHLDNEYKKPTK